MKWCALLLGVFLQVGCISKIGGQNSSLEKANADLRAERAEQAELIESLQQQIESMQQEWQIHEGDSWKVHERTPLCVAITSGMGSGILDRGQDGIPEAVCYYVRSLDQHRRFIPIAATVDMRLLSEDEGVLAEQRYDADAFCKNYTSGIVQANYRLKMELEGVDHDALQGSRLEVMVHDLSTGLIHKDTLELIWPAPWMKEKTLP